MAAFGQAPSPFGAPSTGFSFGGAAASSTPAFGAASAPAFGAPASSTPSLFGASSTPAFGAAASTPAFGTSTFGSSTPAFGASSTPAFGAPATGGLFGAASSAAASSGGAFSFSLPASSQPAAAPAGTGFGSIFSTPAAAPAAGAGIFGQPQQQQQQQQQGAANIFGALSVPGQQQQQQQLSPLAYSSSSHEAVKRELEGIATAYMPGHSSYRFQHIFLNVLDNPAQKVKPAAVVDELSWKQAMRDAGGPDNPDGLWPVAANGFDDLVKRTQAQAEGLAANRARLTELREHAYKQAQRQAGIIARVARAREQHMELSNRLLGVARHVDGLEGRIASFMGLRGELSRGKEANLSRALEAVEAQLSPTSPAGLQRRLDALAAACRLRASSGTLGMGGSSQGGVKLDEASLAQLFAVLKEHVEGLKQLQEVLRRDVLDVEIMRGVRQDSIVPAAMNMAPVELI
uniref:Nucleoporin Nup54 alpha-helical domain-containing protein n=1 Tax=Tetradesmus obliquus TaxID=3088 RepID=A0A383VBV5_TETOB|eukprot:jgi/Sobl393_1/5601/SZX63055.1